MRFVWFQPPLGSAEQPLRLCLALISAPGGKERLFRLSSRGLGVGGGTHHGRPGCSAEQVVATAGREIQLGCRVALEPDERLNRLSIREKICLTGSLAGTRRGGEWVVVTAFQTGYLSFLLSLTEKPYLSGNSLEQLPNCTTGLFSYLKALENSSTVSQRPPRILVSIGNPSNHHHQPPSPEGF